MTPDKIPGFNIALEVVTFIAVVVGFLAIFQSMYTAVLERTREIGILKSMGASKLTIVDVILRETAAMALAGVVLGIAAHSACNFEIADGSHDLVSHAAFRDYRAVGRGKGKVDEGSGDCICGSDVRRALSGVDGGAERSDRRAGLRIVLTEPPLCVIEFFPRTIAIRGRGRRPKIIGKWASKISG
jgi:hypothetical protein